MGYTNYSLVHVTVEEGIARVVIDNPPINIFTAELYAEMLRLSEELALDDEVRVVVVSSANPEFFIAHFDVGLILEFPERQAPTELHEYHRMCERMRTMGKATIAVIEGRVGGGGSEFAASFDMRYALRGGAVFNQPEVALGILPGGSGTVRLSRLIGRSRAMEVILGCDDIDADTAERWGWVNRTLSADELWPFVDRMARRISSFPPNAVREAKASILNNDHNVPQDLLAEAAGFARLIKDPRAIAAMTNFMSRGGQTRDGELRLGALCDEIND